VRFQSVLMTRPLLEGIVRRRLFSLPNIDARQSFQVEDVVVTEDRRQVTGVKGAGAELRADLDATRRGSHSPRWLEAMATRNPSKNACKWTSPTRPGSSAATMDT
jgi:hypothetical protein